MTVPSVNQFAFNAIPLQEPGQCRYVDIKSYNESRSIKSTTVTKFFDIVKNFYRNPDHRLLEVMPENIDSLVRIFMDIENIPFEEPDLIFTIVAAFSTYSGITDYAITQNKSSGSHLGLSYHVYFFAKLTLRELRDAIYVFVYNNPQWSRYIDISVYNRCRLFRVVGAVKPSSNKCMGLPSEKDFHEVIHGTLEETIIQNVENLPNATQLINAPKPAPVDLERFVEMVRRQNRKTTSDGRPTHRLPFVNPIHAETKQRIDALNDELQRMQGEMSEIKSLIGIVIDALKK